MKTLNGLFKVEGEAAKMRHFCESHPEISAEELSNEDAVAVTELHKLYSQCENGILKGTPEEALRVIRNAGTLGLVSLRLTYGRKPLGILVKLANDSDYLSHIGRLRESIIPYLKDINVKYTLKF